MQKNKVEATPRAVCIPLWAFRGGKRRTGPLVVSCNDRRYAFKTPLSEKGLQRLKAEVAKIFADLIEKSK